MITGFYILLFQIMIKVYCYPGHRIQNQFCTRSALFPLPGEHSGQSPFYRRAQCQLNHNTIHILYTGSPFNTWVESSNVDKVSCWRTKVPGDSGIRTRPLSVRVERSHHYTTAPPYLYISLEEKITQIILFPDE